MRIINVCEQILKTYFFCFYSQGLNWNSSQASQKMKRSIMCVHIPTLIWLPIDGFIVRRATVTSAPLRAARKSSECIPFCVWRTAKNATHFTTVENSTKGKMAASCTVAGVAKEATCIAAPAVPMSSARNAFCGICRTRPWRKSKTMTCGSVSHAHQKLCGRCRHSIGL